MADYEHILVKRDGDTVTITMNRAARRNSLTWEHLAELRDAFAEAHALFSESLELMHGLLSDWGSSMNVATFAALAGAQSQYVEAVRLAGASAALREPKAL